MTRNLADYLSEEKSTLIKQHEVAAFRRQVAELNGQSSIIEKRIESLEAIERRRLQ